MRKINVEWHRENKLTDCENEDERMVWRIEHMKNCSCREPSVKQLREIEEWKRNNKI